MQLTEKISNFFSKHMAIIVFVVALISLFYPKTSLWVQTSWINYLLMVIMFGMGLTLKPDDFVLILTRPKDVLIGCLAQFTIMPLLAYILSIIFHLDTALMAGVILVGACPGGTASNVITYISKGDVPLSVCMTSINTLLAPVLTPLITFITLQTTIKVDVVSMFIGILNVILVPIVLGFILNKFFYKITQNVVKILPSISVIGICLIIASVVSHNSEKIYTSGIVILTVVVIHNLLGCLSGFVLGKILKLNPAKTKALSIEIGMQNSGLATSLANTAFNHLASATVPGAIFSVWHNISGAILSSIYRKWNDEKEEN